MPSVPHHPQSLFFRMQGGAKKEGREALCDLHLHEQQR